MAIASSFAVSFPVGISTTLAVFIHEIPHEIGDYALLIQAGFSAASVLWIQCLTALGAMLGCAVGVYLGQVSWYCSYLYCCFRECMLLRPYFFFFICICFRADGLVLPITAGGFIYIATVSVIPELLKETSISQTFFEVDMLLPFCRCWESCPVDNLRMLILSLFIKTHSTIVCSCYCLCSNRLLPWCSVLDLWWWSLLLNKRYL